MKKLITYFIFFLLATGSKAQVSFNETKADVDLYSQREKMTRERIVANNIRSVKSYTYKSDTSTNAEDSYLSSEMNYDEHGNLLNYKLYRKNGAIKYQYAYKWDDAGRNLEFHQLRADGSTKYREENLYDGSGNQVSLRVFGRKSFLNKNEKIWYRSVSKFDEKQNMRQQLFYYDNSDKKLFDRYEYAYYDDGSKKQTVEYNRKGKVRFTWNYDCNPVGKLEAKSMKDSSTICIRYETDKDGNKIKIKEENVKYGKVVRIIHKYDRNENVVEELSYDKAGRARYHSTAVFDDKNNCTARTAYQRNSNQIKERSEIVYDSAGNIIELIAYKNTATPDRILKFKYSR
ncbi:MAG: hypothetical protein ABI763_09510 [Bacteroidota bacterium]